MTAAPDTPAAPGPRRRPGAVPAVNPWAGEVALTVDGQIRRMRLTLGALAELEAELEADSLVALIRRFEEAQFSAMDLLSLLAAGLRGGGWPECQAQVLAGAVIEGGAGAAARAAGELLARAFTVPGDGGEGG